MRQQRLSVTFASLAAALAVVASCSTAAVDDPDAGAPAPDAAPTGPCPGGLTNCGNGKCAQVKRDPENCGKCGAACKAAEFCVQGACSLSCGGGATKCGAGCVNPKTDPVNCGQCGTKCTMGQVCNAGTCAATCQVGLTACAQSCVDVLTDDDNCGKCGTVCDPGQRCSGGTCVASCQQGWQSCPSDGGTTCVDLQHDVNNCGQCGTKCPNGFFCTPAGDGGAPSCQLQCFGGTTLCNGNKCVDAQIDPSNCGGCGVTCAVNEVCSGGHCCATGQSWCNGVCKATNLCDHGPMHTFAGLTTDHYITQGCCSVNCGGNDATDADYFCKHFYGNNCTVMPGYVKHTTPFATYPKMHKNGGCTGNGSDIVNTMCDSGPCKIGNWSEVTSGLANLICHCP
jgi:hypothetical protein